MAERETIIVLEFRGKIDVELRFGPILPLAIAWRLFGIPKRTLQNWVDSRRITKVQVMGQTFVAQQEILAEVERRKNEQVQRV